MSDGYQLDPAVLTEASAGITKVIGGLESMGVAGSAAAGRGFSGLALSGLEVGSSGLKSALDDFCSRWSWGVRTLVQDAQTIAQQLQLSAGTYHETEDYLEGAFKELGASFVANPHATGDQLQQQSWSQMASEAATPDYSAQSFADAGTHAEQTWKAEGRDLMEGQNGMTRNVADLTGHGDELTRAEDSVVGPATQDQSTQGQATQDHATQDQATGGQSTQGQG